jgi:hypothetical protein
MGHEEQKLNEWFNGEKKKGLVDFKITINPNVDMRNMTREQICADINAANDAIAQGKATPINWKELEAAEIKPRA